MRLELGSDNQNPQERFEACVCFDMLDLPTIGLPGKNVLYSNSLVLSSLALGAYQAIFPIIVLMIRII